MSYMQPTNIEMIALRAKHRERNSYSLRGPKAFEVYIAIYFALSIGFGWVKPIRELGWYAQSFLCLIALLYCLTNTRRESAQTGNYYQLLLLSCVCCFVSILFSSNTQGSINSSIKVLMYTIVILYIARTPKGYQAAFKWLKIFLLLHLVATLLQGLLPDTYSRIFTPLIGKENVVNDNDGLVYKACNGFTFQSGMNGFLMSLGLIIYWIEYLTDNCNDGPRKRLFKTTRLMIFLLFSAGVLLTGKRSFLAIDLFVILISAYSELMKRRKGKSNGFFKATFTMLIVISILAIGVACFPSLEYTFWKTSYYIRKGSFLNGRDFLLTEAISIVKENWLFGVGFGAYTAVSPSGMDAHNTYLQLVAEFGFIGSLLFISPFIYGFLRTRAKRRQAMMSNTTSTSKYLNTAFYCQLMLFIYGLSGIVFNEPIQIFLFIIMQTIGLMAYDYSTRTKSEY